MKCSRNYIKTNFISSQLTNHDSFFFLSKIYFLMLVHYLVRIGDFFLNKKKLNLRNLKVYRKCLKVLHNALHKRERYKWEYEAERERERGAHNSQSDRRCARKTGM